jgi:hypothetical protein
MSSFTAFADKRVKFLWHNTEQGKGTKIPLSRRPLALSLLFAIGIYAIQKMQGFSVIGNDAMLHHQICDMPGIIPLLPFVPV